MNALLDRTGTETDRLKKLLDLEANSYLAPALEAMARQGNGRPGVFAITAMRPGRGVSYVARLMAQELAKKHRSETLVITLEQLMRLPYPPRVKDANLLTEWSPRVWTADEKALYRYECPVERLAPRMAELRAWGGGYVLLDCPSLEESGPTLTAAAHTDGILLTVAAGESGRNELRMAPRLFKNCPAPLLGMVLNKRTYAIPKSIYRWL